MIPAEPIIIRFDRRKAVLLAALEILLLCYVFAADLALPKWLALLIGLFIAASAVRHIGLALRNPVALRMDHDGISGFCVAPARWQEIEQISIIEQPEGSNQLGFTLRNPSEFFEHHPDHRKRGAKNRSLRTDYDFKVSQKLLKEHSLEQILAMATAFQAAAAADGTSHNDVT